ARTGGTLDRRTACSGLAMVVCCFWLLGTGLKAQPPEGPPLPSAPEAVSPPGQTPAPASKESKPELSGPELTVPTPPVTTAPLTPSVPPASTTEAPHQPPRARQVLTSAIEMCRRGEYDSAAQLFREVALRQHELTQAEQQELQRWVQINTTAVQSRKSAV